MCVCKNLMINNFTYKEDNKVQVIVNELPGTNKDCLFCKIDNATRKYKCKLTGEVCSISPRDCNNLCQRASN